jgi:peptidoglycan endopeptidase LytE
MKKFGIVFSAAAVAILAGCKSPEYAHKYETKEEVKTCTCAPGTKHTSPCKCGAADCRCVVAAPAPKPAAAPAPKPVAAPAPKPAAPAAAEPEYTAYIVQRGDYLAKISKRYNVTIASIRKLNPSIKKDVVRVGQKIKLPGKIDVGVQRVPEGAFAAPAKKSAKKSHVAYTGATREYTVKSGDSLGAIAYGNGITIRQLKELNSLKSDRLSVGQKLKIPAAKVAAAPVKKESAPAAKKATAPAKAEENKVAPAPAPAAAVEEQEKPAAAESAPVAAETAAPAESVPAESAVSSAAPAAAAPAAETTTYVVQEGDDMTGVSIRWGVSAAAIRELNNLGDNDQLKPGQIIKLPAEAQQ